MSKFDDMLQLIHRGKNPYHEFPVSGWRGTWYNDPGAQREILLRNLDKVNPGIVVEIGSFVGESAIYMARHLKAQKRDAVILCIDTWCGGVDHWLRANEKIQFHFGRVDLYYKFVANVIDSGCQDMILPLSLDSLNAARLLTALGVKADFAYIDASHEGGDVLRDYEAYWPLVRDGGIFLIDDYSGHFEGVVADWNTFAASKGIPQSDWDVSGEKIAVVKR